MPANARWIIILLLVASAVAMVAASRGSGGPRARGSCLVSRDCLKGELCTVVPKDDGFATVGECAARCEDDATCPNGYSCAPFIELPEGYLVPLRSAPRGMGASRTTVCVSRVRSQRP